MIFQTGTTIKIQVFTYQFTPVMSVFDPGFVYSLHSNQGKVFLKLFTYDSLHLRGHNWMHFAHTA